jgi:hypothetical protein
MCPSIHYEVYGRILAKTYHQLSKADPARLIEPERLHGCPACRCLAEDYTCFFDLKVIEPVLLARIIEIKHIYE